MKEESRKKERFPFSTEVIINNIIKAHSLDISEGGMYIATQAEMIERSEIELSFKLDDKNFRVKGIVQHVEPGIGMGVRFIMPPEVLLRAIRESILKFNEDRVKAEAKSVAKRILFVEDDPRSRAIYKGKLLSAGFEVIEASNGIEAFKILQEIKPHLIVTDLWMEGMDGFKILQLLKLNPELSEIPVIILSARSIPADIEKAIRLGAKEFLPKATTSPIKLLEKIRHYLQ